MAEVVTQEFRNRLRVALEDQNAMQVSIMLSDYHPADIAELFDDLSLDDKSFIIHILGNDLSSSVLLELESDVRRSILENLSSKQIAREVITEIDSDDAADVLAELNEDKKREVIAELENRDQATQIVDLLRYEEDSAGGLMGKEFIKINQKLNVIAAVREMRKQAEDMEEVYSVYVVDDEDVLLGTLSLKKLLTTSTTTKVASLYKDDPRQVNVNDSGEDVANYIQKYDLYEVPVVDEMNRLVGRITVDDVIDFIRLEAEKDYQLASGISEDIGLDDNLKSMVRARLPWLFIGVFGGILSSLILDANEEAMSVIPTLILFIPLIAATAGNVGVQSSAIVVQALAFGNVKGGLWKNVLKEISLALITGAVLSLAILSYNLLVNNTINDYFLVSITISLALFIVVIVSASIGTTVPLVLHKRGIDPALATGPFITTSNDLLGIIIYFYIAKLILGI